MIKAIIFDLDGVLVDATEWHYLAMNDALRLFGYTITLEEHQNFYNGLPTRKKLEHLTLEKGLSPSLHDLIYTIKQKYTRQVIDLMCHEDFQKVYMLKKLKQMDYRLAICSNAVRSTVQTMLTRAGLSKFCELVLSNEDIEFAKPNPQIYLKAFEKLGLQPRECLIVEDSEHGKRSAYDSGGVVLEVTGYQEVNFDLIYKFLRKTEEAHQ